MDDSGIDPADAVAELDRERATVNRTASVDVTAPGMEWQYSSEDRSARFGMPGRPGTIVLTCTQNSLNERELMLTVNLPAEQGARERLNLGWGTKRDRIDLDAVTSQATESGYAWSARLQPRGIEANILRTATGPIRFEVGEPGTVIATPAADAMQQAVRACQRRNSPSANPPMPDDPA